VKQVCVCVCVCVCVQSVLYAGALFETAEKAQMYSFIVSLITLKLTVLNKYDK
jgi:hypothetical protein